MTQSNSNFNLYAWLAYIAGWIFPFSVFLFLLSFILAGQGAKRGESTGVIRGLSIGTLAILLVTVFLLYLV